jgi:hypothetical protein
MSKASRYNKPKTTPESARPKARIFYAPSVVDAQNARAEKKSNNSKKQVAYTPKHSKLIYEPRGTRSLTKQKTGRIASDNEFSDQSEEMEQKSPKIYEHTIITCLTSKSRICSPEKLNKRDEGSDDYYNKKATKKTTKKSPARNTWRPAYESDDSGFISLGNDTSNYSTQTSEEPIATFKKTVKIARKADYMSNQTANDVDTFFLTENDLNSAEINPFENIDSQSSFFSSELQPESNSSIIAQRNDTISYTTASSVGKYSYRKPREFSRKSLQSKRSEPLFTSDEDTDTEREENYPHMKLIGSDAIETISSATSTTPHSEFGDAYFVSGESDLAPGQISAIINEIEVSRSPPKKSVVEDEEISLLPEDIGIWLI